MNSPFSSSSGAPPYADDIAEFEEDLDTFNTTLTNLTSDLAVQTGRVDGILTSLSDTDTGIVALNTSVTNSVNGLRTDVNSNASILTTVVADLNALEAQTSLLDELSIAFDDTNENQGTAIASLTGAGAGIAGSIYSSILTRGVASTQGQIIDILEDQFGDTLDNLSNVSNVNSKTTSDVSALQDVVNLANWGRIPGSGTNYDFVITSPGNVGKNLTSNVIRFNHDLYGTTGKISQINSNITTIKSNLYTHDVLIALNADNLAQNVVTINNLSSDYTALNSSVLGAVATLGTLTNSGGTIDTIQSDLASNVTRVETLETDLSSNVTRIELLESNIGSSGSSSNVTYTTVESNLATSTNVYIGDNLTMGEMYLNVGTTQVRPNPTLHIHGQTRGISGLSTLPKSHLMLSDTEYDPSETYDINRSDFNQGYNDFDGTRLFLWTDDWKSLSAIQSADASYDYNDTDNRTISGTRLTDLTDGFTHSAGPLCLNPYGGAIGVGTTQPQGLFEIYGDVNNWTRYDPFASADTTINDYTKFGATSMKKVFTYDNNGRNWFFGPVNGGDNNIAIASVGGGGNDPDVGVVIDRATVFVSSLFVGPNNGYWTILNIGTSSPDGLARCYFRTNDGSNQVTIYAQASSFSDDRLKTDEEFITGATDTLMKLSVQKYKKYENFELTGEYKIETGLIAQDIWYNAPELRHIIDLPVPADDILPLPEGVNTTQDIQTDPDYNALGWGEDEAGVLYAQLIPYLIKSNQEIYTELQAEKAKVTALEARLSALENLIAS